jgi:tripartite-type tricarboxylate transporter receptor subunit TctC
MIFSKRLRAGILRAAPAASGRRRRLTLALAAAAGCSLAPALAWAQGFPDKPLRLVVPFPACVAAYIMARGMAQRLGTQLGQQVVIENRGGAGGTTAAELVARAPADGYTLFFATMGTHAINPALYAKLRYDPVKDFAPVALTHTTPRVLVVSAAVPARNVKELIALAKQKPGVLSYGSAGNGSSSHLSGALFESLAGVQMMHVPYKGSAPLLTDVLAGRVDMTFDSYTVYEEQIRSGRARALAVTSRTRLSSLPDIPTLAESGLAGYDVSNWLGVMAPANTPKTVIDSLNAALVRAMATPELRKQLTHLGIEPASSSPEEFAQLVRTEIPKWRTIVKQSGATLD